MDEPERGPADRHGSERDLDGTGTLLGLFKWGTWEGGSKRGVFRAATVRD